MDFEARRARILSMLKRGVLPRERGVAFELKQATGAACRACRARIPVVHVEYHLDAVDSATVVLCGRCFRIWLVERFGAHPMGGSHERRCLVCEGRLRASDRVVWIDGSSVHEACSRLERSTGS